MVQVYFTLDFAHFKYKWLKSVQSVLHGIGQQVDNVLWSPRYYIRPIRKELGRTRSFDNQWNFHWLSWCNIVSWWGSNMFLRIASKPYGMGASLFINQGSQYKGRSHLFFVFFQHFMNEERMWGQFISSTPILDKDTCIVAHKGVLITKP